VIAHWVTGGGYKRGNTKFIDVFNTPSKQLRILIFDIKACGVPRG